MKNIIKLPLLTVGLILLTGCGSPDSAENKTPANDLAGQENKIADMTSNLAETAPASAKKISADVPDGWTPVKGSVLPVQYMKNTASLMAKTESFADTDLDAVIKTVTEMFNKSFSNFTVEGEAEKIKLSGLDARKLVFTAEVARMKMKYWYVYAKDGNTIYAVTIGDLAATFDQLIPDYEKIVDGIKIE